MMVSPLHFLSFQACICSDALQATHLLWWSQFCLRCGWQGAFCYWTAFHGYCCGGHIISAAVQGV